MRSLLRFALLGLAVGFLFASCNDDNAPTQPGVVTPTPPGATPPPATSTPPPTTATPPAATPTPIVTTATVAVENNRFVDSVSGNATTTITAGSMVTWNFVTGPHST